MKRRFGSRDQEWLHPQHFHDEPVYCEAPHRPEDVLYSGSDDEAYSSAAERRIRLETQARRFIEGKPVFLLSASLRGPFDRTSGWVNPWRSKSDAAYRTGTTQRRKRPAPQRAAGQNDSSNPCPPLTPESKAAEQPQVLYTPPLYMDDDAFERVRNWRDRVIAETIGVPTSAAQSVPHTEPTSADSRRATQQTIRRQSDITPRTPNDELGRYAAVSRGAVDSNESLKMMLSRGSAQVSSGLQPKAVAPVGSSQATISQTCPSSSALPAAAARTIPPDTTDLSPRAVKLYEQLVLSSRESRLPSAKRMVTNETASKATHAGKSLPSTTRGAQKYLKAANSTPLGAVLEATLSSAPAKTQASSRTDGSFRYRRRDGRGKASSLGRSKLADPPSAPNDPSTPANSVGPIAPTAELEKSESNESTGVRRSAKASRAMSGAGQPVDEVSPGIKAQQAPEGASQCHPPQSIQDAGGQATDQGHGYKHDVVEAASQIDGPTLVPSWSPSNSDHMSMPSFGHFSVEKHSQDVVSSAFGLPRRLLWPKSRRSALGDDLFASGLESSDTPVSKPQELGLECCHTQSTCPPAQQKECPPQTVENITTVRMPSEQNVQTSGQRNQHVFPEVVVRGAEGAANGAAERETTSEAEDEHLQRTEEPHIPPEAESAPADQVEPEQSGVSQRPEAQSPWVTDDSAAITRRPSTSHSQHRSDFHSSPPNATQSPWTKETDLAPGASGSACLAPSSHVPAAKPSLVAVEQAASQSPWARGDSQLQLPATRLFKPLSSPASSHVLPTGNTITHSESRDDDVSMHDSQLYPHRPSTPETRQSGLPTPDFTFSVKSFKQFMTPSPRPAAKRRRISAITDDHLPSTQALVDAAISNPWAAQPPSTNSTKPKSKSKSKPKQKHKRPAKRVSWADQAGEEEPSTPSSTHPSDQPAQPASSGSRPRRAAASPPPSILSTAELPAADQKFGRHFAAVASRRVGTTTLKAVPGRCAPSAGSRLLPSASQQVCASPAVGAMAEAFLRADAEAAGVLACDGFGDGERDGDGDWQRAGDGQRTGDEDGDGDGDGDNMDGGRSVDMQEPYQEQGQGEESEDEGMQEADAAVMEIEEEEEEEEEETEEEEPQVDDVSAVLQNLDDFIQSWDLDVELAKARTERERESRAHRDVPGTDAGLSGLLDIGVWD